MDVSPGFRVIIMTVANSTINIRVLRLLAKFKSLKLKSVYCLERLSENSCCKQYTGIKEERLG